MSIFYLNDNFYLLSNRNDVYRKQHQWLNDFDQIILHFSSFSSPPLLFSHISIISFVHTCLNYFAIIVSYL